MKRKGLSILFVVALISSFMGSLALAPASSPLVSEAQAAPADSTVTTTDNTFSFSEGAQDGSVIILKWTEDNTSGGTLYGLTAILIEEGVATLACADIDLEWTYGGEPPTGWQSGGIDCTTTDVALGYDVEYVMGAPGGSELPVGESETWIKAFANRELDAFDGEVIVFQDEEGGTERHYDEGIDTVLTDVVASSEVMYTAELLGSAPEFFETINDAVTAADAGDTVIVHPGTYDEPTTVIDKSLTLESASGNWSDTTINNYPNAEIMIVGNSPFSGHAVIDGFTISGGDYGIYIDGLAHGGTVTVSNCFIYNNGDGIYANGDLDGGIFVDECIITLNGDASDGIYLDVVEGTVEVTDSVVGAYWDADVGPYSGNSGNGIYINEIADTGTVVIDESKIVDNVSDGIHVAGTTSVNGELIITDNIIGCYDYGLEPNGYFDGNGDDGIEITHVGVDGMVTINGNKIAENNYDGIDFGIASPISGTVVIHDNRIGAWTQVEGENSDTYHGNWNGEGIYVWEVDSSGSLTITNNQIADNGCDTGIWIETTSGETTISGNDVGEWTETVLDVEITYKGNCGPGIKVDNVPDGSLTIGPGNTVIGNTGDGIQVSRNDEGNGEVTIKGNVIDANGSGGSHGIYLARMDYATVDGNTITNHTNGYGIYLRGWGEETTCNAIINNTITDNESGIYICGSCLSNGIVGNFIADNEVDGIYVRGDYNDILRNVISGNTGAVGAFCGIFLDSDAEDNVIYYNNITENTDIGSYGVYNDRTVDVDARWNWWGGDDSHLPESYGPFHGGTNPYGEGDAVSSYVDYSEWETTAYPYDTDPTVTPWDTTGPDIDMAVAVPDMVSIYTALSEITDSSWTAETPFSLGPCDDDSRYCVITSDVDAEVPRGVRYVTIDLKDTLEQLLGGTKLEDIDEIEQWFITLVERHGRLKLCDDSFCCDTVWTVEIPRLWYLDKLLDFLGEEQFFLMLEPGELEVPVTVTDWAGNETETTIDIAIVDEQIAVGEGWNLRSTPINLGINDWEHLTALGDGLDYDTAIRWNSELQTWEQLTDDGLLRGGVIVGDAILIPLDAIAIKASNFDSLGLIFNRNTTAAPSLGVHEGWNLIGLAVSPPHDPFMPVDDALISIEEISPDGTRGYIIVDSPRQYVEVIKEYECATCCDSIMYDWYFGQEDWEYLHHGAEAVPPIPLMTIGGGYWVFMERDDTLAGFSNTPVFLSLTLEQHEDIDCVPRYPGTTMVEYSDWMDEEFCEMIYYEPDLACLGGLQFALIEYKGEFTLDDFFTFYEEEMPEVCDWQFAGKGILYQDAYGAEGYIGFWKHLPYDPQGEPPYTLVAGMLAEVNAYGPDYIYVLYVPFDIPTCPGTNLIVWETVFGLLEFDGLCPLYLEFDGSATVDEALAFYIEAMAKLQWDAVDGYEDGPGVYVTEFVKPMILCGEPIMLRCDVVIYEMAPDIIFVEIYRYWEPIIGP